MKKAKLEILEIVRKHGGFQMRWEQDEAQIMWVETRRALGALLADGLVRPEIMFGEIFFVFTEKGAKSHLGEDCFFYCGKWHKR